MMDEDDTMIHIAASATYTVVILLYYGRFYATQMIMHRKFYYLYRIELG